MKKLKVIDLFCGVGGLSYGFANNLNFEILAANEILPNTATAYQLNHPKVKVYCKDIKNFGILDLQKDFNFQVGDIDIIIGGPPCQAYSTIGMRLIGDPRGSLFQEYYRILKEIQPKMFIFENVKGLLSIQKGKLLIEIVDLFKSLGYFLQYQILNSANYGVPQTRERLVLVGSKINNNYIFPAPTHSQETLQSSSSDFFSNSTTGLKPYLSLGEAISDLPFIKSGEESGEYATLPNNDFQVFMRKNSTSLLDHNSPKNNPTLVKIMELLPDGGTPLDLPIELRPKSGFANTYSRLWWNKPSPTITRNLSTPSSSRCIHPKAPRPLTTREGARLQGFPDNYVFFGTRSDKNLQIGNAVPTFLSIALANSIYQYLKF